MIQVIIGVVEIILRERTLSRSTDVRESCKAKFLGYVFNTLDTTFKSVLLESVRIHHSPPFALVAIYRITDSLKGIERKFYW